jgi:predicted GH43/DUF377 family glycosyl hydrolase
MIESRRIGSHSISTPGAIPRTAGVSRFRGKPGIFRRLGRLSTLPCLFLLAGCGRYADFTLPAPPAGPPIRFEWDVRPQPVLDRGAPGEWDSSDVLNPSVVRFGAQYLNVYSGFDGTTWHTGLATSADGIHWEKRGERLSPDPGSWEGGLIAANGSALARGGGLWYWYQAGSPPRIGLARSPNGFNWIKFPSPVLDVGPVGSWDERGIGDPYVIEERGVLYMFYLGMDRARRQRLGVARSGDGVHWVKLRSNPILDLGQPGSFDENGLGEPAVWGSNGYYWMLYTGRDRNEVRRIGMARSKDGVDWARSDAAPVLTGAEAWDSKVVCDPAVQATPEAVYVWFGGGDVARPDQGLDGEIGFARLRVKPAQ